MNKLLIRILLALSLLTSAPSVSVRASGQNRPCTQRGFDATPFLRTELFFGARKPDGTEVSKAEWDQFLEKVITPKFPNGLTVLSGNGQFQSREGDVIEEKGRLLILLSRDEPAMRATVESKRFGPRTRMTFYNNQCCVWMIPPQYAFLFRFTKTSCSMSSIGCVLSDWYWVSLMSDKLFLACRGAATY